MRFPTPELNVNTGMLELGAAYAPGPNMFKQKSLNGSGCLQFGASASTGCCAAIFSHILIRRA